ncbi:MAG: hypothetical protein IJX24_00165 [Oscillospiraceae bacterium]|nr:hypothetical protein [Oscillospiraceae bacterium]
MKFYRCFITDMKKILLSPYFIIGITAFVFMCFTSSIYFDFSTNREYNVFETFLNYRNVDDYTVSAEYISRYGFGGWISTFLSILVAFPFINIICDENQNGAKRYIISRVGVLNFSVSKILTAIITSALICLVGYLIFTAFVYLMFPSLSSMSEAAQENAYFPESYIQKLTEIVLQGVAAGLIPLFLSAFMQNKYFCLCIPFFVSYFRHTVSNKVFCDTGNYNIASLIAPDSVNLITYENEMRMAAIIIYSAVLLTVSVVFYISQKGRTDNGT